MAIIFLDNPCKLVPECHLSGFYWSKDDGDDDDNWSYAMCKASVKSSNHHPTFYRLDALFVAQLTVCEH